MRLHRCRTALAVPAVFVALLVVAMPIANRDHGRPIRAASGHDTAARGAELPLATSVAASTSRRLLSVLDGASSVIAATRSVVLALLGWAAVALSAWVVFLCAGLTRRGRAPPFARA